MANPTEQRMVTALFNDRDSAERAYQSVSSRGYDNGDVNVVMSDETRIRIFSRLSVFGPASAVSEISTPLGEDAKLPRGERGSDAAVVGK